MLQKAVLSCAAFGDSYEAELDLSLCGSCEVQKHCGMLNEITSNQGFSYSPKIPFITTTQMVKGLESYFCVFDYH